MPRLLKASASWSDFSRPALITAEQPAMRWSAVAASSPSHQRRSCGVCAVAAAATSNRPATAATDKRLARATTIDNSMPGGQAKSCRRALSFLSQRMQVAHQALEPLRQHMGVDLRRGDIGMAEQRLHHPQVGAVVEKMAGESVAEHVRAYSVVAQAGGGGERLQLAGEVLAGEVAGFAERGEQPFRFPVTLRLGEQREIFVNGTAPTEIYTLYLHDVPADF